MFSFFNKLSKKEKKNLLNIEYTQAGINIKFNKEVSDLDLAHFYNEFFLELSHDGLAVLNNGILHIENANIYPLLLDERASMLMLPSDYTGSLEIKHRGLLKDNARFEYKFLLNNHELFGYEILGSILKISNSNYLILPKDMYEVLKLIDIAHTSGKTYDRYIVIEYIQGLDGEKVSYNGLLDNDFVTTVKGVGVEIKEEEDGSLNIQPLIPGLDHEDVLRNHNTILNHDDDSLLLTKTSDGKIIRFALDDKKLSGAKKILQTKKISKSQAKVFKENPEAFLPNFDHDEIDLDLGYRILGYTTELYVGYFGSEKLETPMSQVLNSGSDTEVQIIETLEKTIENMSVEDKNSLQERIKNALENGDTKISINDEEYSIEMITEILDKSQDTDISKESKPEKESITKKTYLLKIKSNDETSIDETEINLGQDPSKINLSDKKMAMHWQNIKFEPFPHQVVALNWMVDLFNQKFPGALLADDMGLGKTFQIISFINYLYNVKNVDCESHRILIVAPTTLLSAWKNEIENFVIDQSAFRVRIIQGRNNALKKMSDKIKDSINMGTQPELNDLVNNDADVINLLRDNIYVTTYETMSNYQLVFSQQNIFNFVMNVYDEAQKIKNPNARVTVAAKGISSNIPFSMLVTGTPIENELRDLWSLFDTIDPVFIESWKAFREKYVKSLKNEDTVSVENKLREKISNYMLRRLKQEHLKGLPEKNFKDIDVEMSLDEIVIHNDILMADTHHMEKLQDLRLLSLHPSLLKVDKMSTPDLMKELIDQKTFFNSSKMNALVNILNEVKKKKEKILIFIIRYSMQTLLKTALDKKYGLNITIINGKNNNQTYVDEKLATFEATDGFDIMILSPLAAGVGLTITAANHVVHLERHWNPAKEDQASDRVYRIGQTKDVNIFHLIHKSTEDILTFDQGLHKLISNKRELSNGTLIPTPSVKDSEIIESFFGTVSDEEYLQNLSPEEFEQEVFGLFQKAGYKCHFTSKQPTESGTDIIAINDTRTIAIQCKHTRKNKKQGRDAIRQLVAEAMPIYSDAIFVAITNYYFNSNARDLARSHNIICIERKELIKIKEQPNVLHGLISI
jgi:SNF2 family DNA or RNA helicase